MKLMYVFSISPNYTRCQVFAGSRKTHQRVGTSTLTLNKGLKRRQRYDEIAEWLSERFQLPIPSYQPTKREAKG